MTFITKIPHARSLHVRPDGTRERVDHVTSIARYAVRSAPSRRSVSAISVLSNCNYVHEARQERRVYLWRAGEGIPKIGLVVAPGPAETACPLHWAMPNCN